MEPLAALCRSESSMHACAGAGETKALNICLIKAPVKTTSKFFTLSVSGRP